MRSYVAVGDREVMDGKRERTVEEEDVLSE